MKKRTLFFDIDGTLLDNEIQTVPESAKEALQKLQHDGHNVAIATGRTPYMFDDLRSELNIQNYVSINGQYVLFGDDVIFDNPIPEDVVEHMIEYGRSTGIDFGFLGLSNGASSTDDAPYIAKAFGDMGLEYPEVDLEFYKKERVYQKWVFGEKEELDAFLEVPFKDIQFIRWHMMGADALSKGVSKATGIEAMLQKLGVSKNDTIAFGDGNNDLEMLQYVGTGIAMGNAGDELKNVADDVTTSVSEDGIYNALKKLELI